MAEIFKWSQARLDLYHFPLVSQLVPLTSHAIKTWTEILRKTTRPASALITHGHSVSKSGPWNTKYLEFGDFSFKKPGLNCFIDRNF